MKSQQILNILAVAKKFSVLPSTVLNIDGEYPAYCFNEACMFLLQALEDGKTLKFEGNKEQKKHFRSASEYYESIGVSV